MSLLQIRGKKVESAKPLEEIHIPVLLQECLDLLAPAIENKTTAVMIDATLGMGGHSYYALERFENLKVIGIDRDEQAIAIATKRLEKFGDRFQAVHTTYDNIDQVVANHTDGAVDAILMDLGVSSLQLDSDERGFSYSRPVELDMRMDKSATLDAKYILQNYSSEQLAKILYLYGEEKFSRKIADAIVEYRKTKAITTSEELAQIIKDALPMAVLRNGKNPCKKTFQALRIEVNQELEILKNALPKALSALNVGGRLVVESYHSLEDRLVKTIFNQGATSSAPADMPIVPVQYQPYLKLVTKKAIKAHEEEIAHNLRAQSVRLRAAEKIRNNTEVKWRTQ